MSCACQKGKTCPQCLAAADLALEPGRVSSPAFYEERIRLLTAELEFWYREFDKAHRLDSQFGGPGGGDSATAVVLNSLDERLHSERL